MIDAVIAQLLLDTDGQRRSQGIAVLKSNGALQSHHIQSKTDDIIIRRENVPQPFQRLKIRAAVSYERRVVIRQVSCGTRAADGVQS